MRDKLEQELVTKRSYCRSIGVLLNIDIEVPTPSALTVHPDFHTHSVILNWSWTGVLGREIQVRPFNENI